MYLCQIMYTYVFVKRNLKQAFIYKNYPKLNT